MLYRSLIAVLAAAWFLGAPPLAATGPFDELPVGLKTGEPVPKALQAVDQNGDLRNFDSLKGSRGLILLFTRSLDW
jgi:hypothetical protein